MFILKRQDVEISSIQHPNRDQQIPILQYQGQTFRLISVFSAAQEDDARGFWRDLTDNRGKACVLLEEPERYSVWGKVRLDQMAGDTGDLRSTKDDIAPFFVQASLLLLQAVYIDVEDLLGGRQAGLFQKELASVLQKGRFPHADSPDVVNQLLTVDPLASLQMPPWQEQHLHTLLQELYRLAKELFGNANFTERVMDALLDMPANERNQFLAWLKNSPAGSVWQ